MEGVEFIFAEFVKLLVVVSVLNNNSSIKVMILFKISKFFIAKIFKIDNLII